MKSLTLKKLSNELLCKKKKIYRIYKITNLLNHKIYIGRTHQMLFVCFEGHFKIKHTPLSKDMYQYGIENFVINEMCKCDSLKDARLKEFKITNKFLQQGYELYNIRIGDKMSEDEKRQISQDIKEHKMKGFGHNTNTWNKGKSWSNETKKKMSESHKGQRPSDYCLKRSLEVHFGSKQSKETIEKRRKNFIKKVLCVTTKEVFDSKQLAAEKFGLLPYKIAEYSYKRLPYGKNNEQDLYWKMLSAAEKKKLLSLDKPDKYINDLCQKYMKNVSF